MLTTQEIYGQGTNSLKWIPLWAPDADQMKGGKSVKIGSSSTLNNVQNSAYHWCVKYC